MDTTRTVPPSSPRNNGCTTLYARWRGDQGHCQRCCGGTLGDTMEHQHSRGWESQPQPSSCGGGGMRRRCSEYIPRRHRAGRSANQGHSRSPESARKGNRRGGLSREPCIGCGRRGCAKNSHGVAPCRHQRGGRVPLDLLGRNQLQRPMGGRDAEHADESDGRGCAQSTGAHPPYHSTPNNKTRAARHGMRGCT